MSLHWLVTGQTIGGMTMYPTENRLDRITALRLWTEANTWFSNEEGKKGAIKAGQLADVAVLSADYMTVPEEQIKQIVSVLTLVGGSVVHGSGPFAKLAPPLPPLRPDWSPVSKFGGYHQGEPKPSDGKKGGAIPPMDQAEFWGALGCDCWIA